MGGIREMGERGREERAGDGDKTIAKMSEH